MSKARRRPARGLDRCVRRARHAACVMLAVLASTAAAQSPEAWKTLPLETAHYVEPTSRYAHGVLGDSIEYGALELSYGSTSRRFLIRLPEDRVFEDIAPRLADVDGDGRREAVVVESHSVQGARLAIYDAGGLIAATPWIGRRFRWLAPVAIADFDGDGRVELAYVDRPHLAKILRVWRLEDGEMVEIAALDGLTNHRIGERDIAGGVRDCGTGPEMILADAGWRRLMAVRLSGATLSARDIGPHQDRESFAAALAC